MLPSLTSVLLSLGLLAIVYGLYSLILKPWIQLGFYRKQGCEMKFFPVLGNYKACIDTLKSHNDFYGNFKLQLKKNPELKGIGGNLLGSAQVYLTDPDEVTEFYKQTEKYVRSTAGLDLFKLVLGDGLVMINGEMWKRHRKIISSTFHYEFLKKILPGVGEITQQFLENFKKKDLNEFALMHGFETITGEVVGRVFFGTKFSEYRVNGVPITQFITDVAGRVGSEVFGPWYLLLGVWSIKCGLLPRFKTLMKDLDSLKTFVRNIIDARRETLNSGKSVDSDGTALIDALLMSGNMSSQEIIDEFITFFLGGMDTTGHNLGLSLYYLAKNPQYKQRLIDEANQYVGEPSEITIEKLNEMEFTTAFLKEGLRFSCPAAVLVDRVALQDHKLHNLQIKKGTLVNVTLLGNGFNPKYHDDVDAFDPYRWINDTKTKRSVSESPRIYLPFSAGPQNCIGQHLAMNESKIILAMFLKKYDFELSPNYVHKMTLRLLHEPANTMTFKLIPK